MSVAENGDHNCIVKEVRREYRLGTTKTEPFVLQEKIICICVNCNAFSDGGWVSLPTVDLDYEEEKRLYSLPLKGSPDE